MGLKDQQGQGPNYVPAYQTAGTPFVTSSVAGGRDFGPTRIRFPYVTKTLTIQNLDNDTGLRVAFSVSGSYKVGETVKGGAVKPGSDGWQELMYQGNNYFIVPQLGTAATPGLGCVTLDARCKEVYLMADHASNTVEYSLYAGLTGISYTQFPVLTASNKFKGIG